MYAMKSTWQIMVESTAAEAVLGRGHGDSLPEEATRELKP